MRAYRERVERELAAVNAQLLLAATRQRNVPAASAVAGTGAARPRPEGDGSTSTKANEEVNGEEGEERPVSPEFNQRPPSTVAVAGHADDENQQQQQRNHDHQQLFLSKEVVRGMCWLTSSLKAAQRTRLRMLAARLGVPVLTGYSTKVTHLITSTECKFVFLFRVRSVC